MRTRKHGLASDESAVTGNPAGVAHVEEIIKTPVLISLLPVISALAAMIPEFFMNASGTMLAKTGILTLILTAAAVFYIRQYSDSIYREKYAKEIIAASYLFSIFLLMLVPNADVLTFWMIGGLIVSMLVDNRLGLFIHFNLSFILGISMSLRPELVLQLLVIGVLMSILSEALKQLSTAVYAMIIILSANITIAFAMNNFIFEAKKNYNYLFSLFSIAVVLAAAFLFCHWYHKLTREQEELRTAVAIASIDQSREETAAETADGPEQNHSASDSMQYSETKTSYEILCDENNTLLNKIKEYSQSLYEHALKIGDLSCRAAMEIGADELLAKAGGFYHEAGKIYGKNYIEENLKIAEEYSFPKELTAILKQHNIKYEKPTSVEAAIVMLSDNVVSTIVYIKKTEEDKFTTNKIIDNVFQMRMEKGTFDESGLSVKDYKKLKEFYQREYNQ